MICVKPSFFSKKEEHSFIRVEEYESYRLLHPSVCEVLESPEVMVYFDVDIKHLGRCPWDDAKEIWALMDFHEKCIFVLDRVIDMAQTLVGATVKFIADSSSPNYFDPKKQAYVDKISYFLVLEKIALKTQIKEWAKTLGYPFDPAPYSSYQIIRGVNTSKPGESRPKKILLGNLQDSFCGIANEKENQKIATVHQSMRLLPEKWSPKSAEYDTWLQVCFFLVYEAQLSGKYEEAKRVFIFFSSLSETFSYEKACIKFDETYGKVRQCHWNLMKNWMQSFTTIEEFEPDEEIIPDNLFQYEALILCSTEKLQTYWRSELKTIDDLKKIRRLLNSHFDDAIRIEYLAICREVSEVTSEMEEVTNSTIRSPFPKPDQTVNDKILMLYAKLAGITCTPAQIRQCEQPFVDFEGIWNIEPLLKNSRERTLPMRMLRKLERHNSMERIFTIVHSERLYTSRIPYYDSLRELYFEICKEDKDLFALFIPYCTIFEAEQWFHYIAQAYSEEQAISIVTSLYPFWIRYRDTTRKEGSSGIMVFDSSKGMWSSDEIDQKRVLCKFRDFLYYKVTFVTTNHCNSNENLNRMLSRLLIHPFSSSSKQLSFYQNHKDSSVGKLLFANGYYDAILDKFIPARIISNNDLFGGEITLFDNHDIIFYHQISDNYIPEPDEDLLRLRDEMRQVLFYNMHGEEIGMFRIVRIAMAIFGMKHKGFLINVGETNSGKSTELEFLRAVFQGYVGGAMVDDFALIKDDRREAAIINSYVVDNWNKRIVPFSEGTHSLLKTEMLKSHSSGGLDQIVARKTYGIATRYDIHFMLFFYVNPTPGIKFTNPNDDAIVSRAEFVQWQKMFVKEVTDPTSQCLVDERVPRWLYSLTHRQAYTQIIVEAFRAYRLAGFFWPIPDEVKFQTQQEVGHIKSDIEIFELLMYEFIFDGQSTSVVAVEVLEQAMEKIGEDKKRVGMKIARVVGRHGNSSTIYSMQVSVRGERKRIWKGIRSRNPGQTFVNNFVLGGEENEWLTNFQEWKELVQKYQGSIPDKATI